MPQPLTYPGVYIEELPSGVRTITGVATSITAFLGRAVRGPVDEPTTITSYAEFERIFGSLNTDYQLGYAVRDFYLNGGTQAIIVRLHKTAIASKDTTIKLEAASRGTWGDGIVYTVDYTGITDDVAKRYNLSAADLFNLTLYDNPPKGRVEKSLNVSVKENAGPQRLDRVLTTQSSLARVLMKADGTPDLPSSRPGETKPEENPADSKDPTKFKKLSGGKDGSE